ncbi:MAG: hypothetical protein OJF51_001545 [Nitrospira sp.]|jgi:hypothetical protein|nr:MAG: hypothetical protein OJF51_001545 [Nitrospira sp.]
MHSHDGIILRLLTVVKKPLAPATIEVDDRSLLHLNPDCHTDRMDGFLNAIRSSQIHLLRIDIRPKQPIPHGKQDLKIFPGPPDLSQVMHAMIPTPVGVVRKRDSIRQLCGKDEENWYVVRAATSGRNTWR